MTTTQTKVPLMTGERRQKLQGWIKSALIESGRESESDYVLAQHVNAVANANDLWDGKNQTEVKELAEAYVLFYDQFKSEMGDRKNVSEWARRASIATLRDQPPPDPPRADAPDDLDTLEIDPEPGETKNDGTSPEEAEDTVSDEPAPGRTPLDGLPMELHFNVRSKTGRNALLVVGGITTLAQAADVMEYVASTIPEAEQAAVVNNPQNGNGGQETPNSAGYRTGDSVTIPIKKITYASEPSKGGDMQNVLSFWHPSSKKQYAELRITDAGEIAQIGAMMGTALELGRAYEGPFTITCVLGDLREGKSGKYTGDFWRNVTDVSKAEG